MPTDGERLAALEQMLRDMRDNFDGRKQEETRTRERLHKLEGMVGLLVNTQKEARRAESVQYRRLELRLQWLSVCIAFGGAAMGVALAVWGH